MLFINLFVGVVYIEFRRSKVAQEIMDKAAFDLQQKSQSVAVHIEDADGGVGFVAQLTVDVDLHWFFWPDAT